MQNLKKVKKKKMGNWARTPKLRLYGKKEGIYKKKVKTALVLLRRFLLLFVRLILKIG